MNAMSHFAETLRAQIIAHGTNCEYHARVAHASDGIAHFAANACAADASLRAFDIASILAETIR
jgi:hypothetical protein